MKYKILLSRRAKEDRKRAYAWYAANYSSDFADRWFLGITESIESLATNPLSCPKASESEFFSFEVRELLYGSKKNKHRVLFTIRDDLVYVLHIRHSARTYLREDEHFDV